jgi:hypothetical protein
MSNFWNVKYLALKRDECNTVDIMQSFAAAVRCNTGFLASHPAQGTDLCPHVVRVVPWELWPGHRAGHPSKQCDICL